MSNTDKKIPPRSRLIIFDCYDTLVEYSKEHNSHVLRRGIPFLLWELRQRKLAISSDGDEEEIQRILGRYSNIFEGVYGASHMICSWPEDFKNLGMICEDLGVAPKDTTMIGDNLGGVDEQSSQRYNIGSFIEVPREDSRFDFMTLFEKSNPRPIVASSKGVK